MTRTNSTILMTVTRQKEALFCTYRLICTIDPFRGETVFSIFVSSIHEGMTDEEFVYDITREEEKAKILFSALSEGQVSACTMQDVLHDLLAEV